MNSDYIENDEKKITEPGQLKTCNWKMSYNVVKTNQQNVILQHKYSYLLYTHRTKLKNTCPAVIKILERVTRVDRDDTDSKLKYEKTDDEFGEYEPSLDKRTSDFYQLEEPKLKTWDEYKKLVELARSKPTIPRRSPLLAGVSSQPQIRINVEKYGHKSQPSMHARASKSIMKMDIHKTILIANTNYVQFRNFKLNKLYKKIVMLQNVSASPAKYQIQPRPSCSKFCVLIERHDGIRNIVPSGMRFRLIVLFRSEDNDEPEEMLVLKVENGKSLVIKLHGYKEPPILLGTCPMSRESIDSFGSNADLFVQPWHPETSSSESSDHSCMESIVCSVQSWSTIHNKFASTIFECKTSFVGETIRIPINFKNVGGDGIFFVMSEVDWTSMHIQDIMDTNVLKLSHFTIWPAYFVLKAQEQMIMHTSFLPDCYGVHVDKVYILCNNCTILATEIIGDGLIYESNFIQLSEQLEKVWPIERNIDKRAKYCIKLNASTPNIYGQATICVTNTSDIGMYFYWKTRDAQIDEEEMFEQNHFPLEYLRIQPERGIFVPNSVHHFTITGEFRNLQPNLYFAVLQLYVEDIPEEAVSEKLQSYVTQCTRRRRECLTSVDVWVADVEVWLRYTMDDQIKSDQMFYDLTERLTDENIGEELEETEIIDHSEYSEDDKQYKSISQLEIDERFSHYDIVNLKQFEPLLRERVVSIGIIRPTRTLYIGIEETCILTIKNLSDNSLLYSWGEASGSDAAKMKVCVCPEEGQILGGATNRIKVTLTPIKEGIVQFLHMPCFIENWRKIIMLGIECYIEPLHVTFYFPLSKKKVDLKNNFIRVEWHVDSLQLALDLAGRSKKGMKLLDKYRAREEQELMNINLDQGDILKDASAGPSTSEVAIDDPGEQFILSTRTSEIVEMTQLSNWATENGKNSQKKVISSEDIIPFFKTPPSSYQQAVVIEFLNLRLRTVEKKSFIIKNETSIPTDFRLHLKHFHPNVCSCEKNLENRINSIYKQVHCNQKRLIEETMLQLKQPKSGIVIYVDPLNSNISPFEAVTVNIYVYGDTWGIYVDELEIDINGLPRYTLAICVQIVGSPIWLSISDKDKSKIPVLKYGTTMKGVRLQTRKIMLRNTSVVPIAIDWHSFIIKPERKKMPFNVVFDFRTSLTDQLASELRIGKQNGDSDFDMSYERFGSKTQNLNKLIPESLVNSESVSTYNSLGSSHMDVSWEANYKSSQSFDKSYENNHRFIEDTKFIPSNISNSNIIHDVEDTEFNVSIIPYYGHVDTETCTVTPREMFVLPKNNAFLTISIHPEKYSKENYETEFLYKILGFLRIAPCDKYKDNCYFRQDGNYLPPTEIDITADIVQPTLTFHISKEDRTFTCCAYDVMQSKEQKLEVVRTFFLYNYGSEPIRVIFETFHPFSVKSVSTYAKTKSKLIGAVYIHGKACTEVEITCTIDVELIETIIHTSKSQDLFDSVITISEPLQILHTDKHSQDIELILKVWLPIIKLSSYALNFGVVYVGDTKKLTLVIKNFSICHQDFKIKQRFKNDDFEIDHTDGILLGYPHSKSSCFTVTVSFQPKNPGLSNETLEVITNIPYNAEECEIYGEGTLDEKYHTPGV